MNYSTFLSDEGCEILKLYLDSRVLKTKEKLNKDSPVITISRIGYDKMGKSKYGKNYGSLFINTANISREVRRAWRKIDPKPPQPYVLRSYFDTRLMLAESQGKISHAYRQHFMGHKGDIEPTQKQTGNLEETKKYLLSKFRQEAEMYNIKIEDIELKVKKEKLDPDEEIKLLQEEIVKVTAPQIQPLGTIYKNSDDMQHKIIAEKQLVKHLNEGWILEREINGGKFLIKK